jgi:hypothetical protein
MTPPKSKLVWKNEVGLPGARRGWYLETERTIPHPVFVRLVAQMLPRIRKSADTVPGSRREEWQFAAELLSQWLSVEQTVMEAQISLKIDRERVEREIYAEPTFAWLREQLKTYVVAQHVHNPKGARLFAGTI